MFDQIAGVSVHYIRKPDKLEAMDMIILPGTKNTIADLVWMRESGMESAVKKFAEHGPVFGICGGYQMLGMSIRDPYGVEEAGEIRGLELLPMETELTTQKRRSQVQGTITLTEGVLHLLVHKRLWGMRFIWAEPAQCSA